MRAEPDLACPPPLRAPAPQASGGPTSLPAGREPIEARPAGRLSIAYVHYGAQSEVTPHVLRALEDAGHEVALVTPVGRLEPRDPRTGRLRLTPEGLVHLAAAALRFGRRALAHRWNTAFAFDFHSRVAGEALAALPCAPEIVLQNGALFAPGAPARTRYALLLDHTRALAERPLPLPRYGLGPAADYGAGWRAREERVYRDAALLATFSRHVATSLVADYGVDPRRITVVGAGANVFPPSIERLDDGRTILFLGREFQRKGGPVLLEAFASVRRLVPDARLLVAGPRERLALPPGAEHLGPVPLAAIPGLLAQATVFALPTLREPFGLALLDAMACGVPCVATRIEAIPEIVLDGDAGLLVEPADPHALAAALVELLRSPGRARAMGARGRDRVSRYFLWRHVGARLGAALCAAAGTPGAADAPPDRAGASGEPHRAGPGGRGELR